MNDIQFGCRLMECAKEMIRESLPIKCLEAVILAMYSFDAVIVKQLVTESSLCYITAYNPVYIRYNVGYNFQFITLEAS